MSPVVKISPRYTLSFEIVWVVLSGFYLARARGGIDPRADARTPDVLNCDCMGLHAARRMAMVHGAEARGRYRVCESVLTPSHTSSSPRS